MEEAETPVLEIPFGPKRDMCVIAYPRKDGFNVWVYAWDKGKLGRCKALRVWKPKRSEAPAILLYEIGDLDQKTQVDLNSLLTRELK